MVFKDFPESTALCMVVLEGNVVGSNHLERVGVQSRSRFWMNVLNLCGGTSVQIPQSTRRVAYEFILDALQTVNLFCLLKQEWR